MAGAGRARVMGTQEPRAGERRALGGEGMDRALGGWEEEEEREGLLCRRSQSMEEWPGGKRRLL